MSAPGPPSERPELRTPRLRLRAWSSQDLPRLVELFAEPEVWWYPFGRGLRADETEAFLGRRLAEWSTNGWGTWAVEDAGRLIGYVGLSRPSFLPEVMPTYEIGWRLDPSSWGRGLALEAARAALEHGFVVVGLDEVVSIYEPDNVRSGRLMQRLGMTFDRDTVDPERGVPLRVYRLRRRDWAAFRTTAGRDRA